MSILKIYQLLSYRISLIDDSRVMGSAKDGPLLSKTLVKGGVISLLEIEMNKKAFVRWLKQMELYACQLVEPWIEITILHARYLSRRYAM